MGHGDGQTGAGQVAQEQGRRSRHFHQAQARLELFRAIAQEARPVRSAGNQRLELGEHLAAIADPQGKAVGSLEEGLEHITQLGIEQDAFGPAAACPQHVAERETATGRKPVEVRE
jgi:hypothetical protein